jgi:hypothetical protein
VVQICQHVIQGPCPNCGKLGKRALITLTENIGLKESIGWEWRKEFFKQNPKIKSLIIVITFGSPFVSLVMPSLPRFVISFALAFLRYLLGPYVAVRVRQIVRYHLVQT